MDFYLHVTKLMKKLPIKMSFLIASFLLGLVACASSEEDLTDNAESEGTQSVCTSAAVSLTSLCSANPALHRAWRVRNGNTASVNVSWKVYGTGQTGTYEARTDDSFFLTSTIGGPNTVVLTYADPCTGQVQSTVKASGGAACLLGTQSLYSACSAGSSCQSGLCYSYGQAGSLCSQYCRNDADCPAPSSGCNNRGVCKRPGGAT